MATPISLRKKIPSIEEGWPALEEVIKQLISQIDAGRPVRYTSEQFMNGYRIVYDMCPSQSPAAARVPEKLYDHYQKTYEDYVSSKVMPHLREKNGAILLKELVQQWGKYKTIGKGLSRIFCHLDRTPTRETCPSLEKTSNLVFYNLVYGEINDQVRAAVVYEINREEKGEEIDREVLKNAVEIYMEMAEGSDEYYEEDFETAILTHTAWFYSEKHKELQDMSINFSERYLQKVKDLMDKERIKVFNYLKPSSFDKITKIMQLPRD